MNLIFKWRRILAVVISFCVIMSLLCSCIPIKKAPSPNGGGSVHPPAKSFPTVIIDAGHGGEDGGAVGVNGVYEKDLNLSIALELQRILTAAGIDTRLTRSEDKLLYDRNADYEGRKKALDMEARLSIAKEYENAIFISIHMNKFTQSKYSGLQVYYSENSPLSLDLAQTVQTFTVKNIQPNNTRKIKPSSGSIYLLEQISLPCILIECGFLSNPEECEKLCDEEYQKKLSMVIYMAIMNYFDSAENNPSNIS